MTGCPIIDGVAGHLDCTLVASHEAGDHIIFVGEVQALDLSPDAEPLVFHAAATGRCANAARRPRSLRRMTRYLHTMYRITDPEKSRAFYEALGLEFRRDMDIVRNGEKEATNYFFGVPGQDEELELTFNHDGRTYDLGTGYGHVALSVDDLSRRSRR